LALSNAAKAGAAVFVGTVLYGMSLLLSEVYYAGYGSSPGEVAAAPYGYSVFQNHINDFGATCPSGTACYIPPSAVLFDAVNVVLGILVLVAAYYLYISFRYKPLSGIVALAGIGLLGVGTFNETFTTENDFFSLVAFLFAGLSAMVSYRFQRAPMRYFSLIAGVVSLVSLLLFLNRAYLGLGPGGMERMIVYPVLLWAVGFGGHLMSMEDPR